MNKEELKSQLETEANKWQQKVDELKIQMNLAAKDAQDAIQPHVDSLEQELEKAKGELQKVGDASENAWQEISHGLSLSYKAMQQAFDKAEKHFKK